MSKRQEAGFCPVCKCSDLDYNVMPDIDGDTITYGWSCPKCKSVGDEIHTLTFLEHQIGVNGNKQL